MKKLSKKFVQLSVVGTLLIVGGLFVTPQVQNSAAQASEPTKLVAFDQQANALGETINEVRESKTVTKALDKAQETATKKQKASQKVAETKVQVQNTATEQTSNDNQNAATTKTNEVTETTSINNTPNTNQAAVPQQSAPAQQGYKYLEQLQSMEDKLNKEIQIMVQRVEFGNPEVLGAMA